MHGTESREDLLRDVAKLNDRQAWAVATIIKIMRGRKPATKEERWCMAMLLRCKGMTASQTADQMGVSVRTVYTYCTNLLNYCNSTGA